MAKKTIDHVFNLFGTSLGYYDLIAVKLVESDNYYVINCNFTNMFINNKLLSPGTIISSFIFSQLILKCNRPLVLNDDTVDMDKVKEYCRLLGFYGISKITVV